MSLREEIEQLVMESDTWPILHTSIFDKVINKVLDAAIEALNEAGLQVDITTDYGEGECDALCITANDILQALKKGKE